jgi:hypothetical protein
MTSSKLDMDKLKLKFTSYSVQKPSIKKGEKRGFFPLDKHMLRGNSDIPSTHNNLEQIQEHSLQITTQVTQ